MSRRSSPHARAVLAALALAGATACDEEGKAVPSRCTEPPLPLYDFAHAGAPADGNARFNDDPARPCVTEVGHAIGGVSLGVGGGASSDGSSDAMAGAAGSDAGAGGA